MILNEMAKLINKIIREWDERVSCLVLSKHHFVPVPHVYILNINRMIPVHRARTNHCAQPDVVSNVTRLPFTKILAQSVFVSLL